MIPVLRDFNHIIRKKFFKNWQANTLEVDLDLYSRHMSEVRIKWSTTDLDLSAGLTNTRIYTVVS